MNFLLTTVCIWRWLVTSKKGGYFQRYWYWGGREAGAHRDGEGGRNPVGFHPANICRTDVISRKNINFVGKKYIISYRLQKISSSNLAFLWNDFKSVKLKYLNFWKSQWRREWHQFRLISPQWKEVIIQPVLAKKMEEALSCLKSENAETLKRNAIDQKNIATFV